MLKLYGDFTKRQWLTLVMLCVTDFCSGLCVSLPAPFYPLEAETKGASATEYGFVFGVFELTVFISSPIFARRLNVIGPRDLLDRGMFTVGICTLMFGCLDVIKHHLPFILLSFVLRILGALGNAAYMISSFAISATEFSDNLATVFAIKETCIGIGLLAGPTLGAALFLVGGYTMPFVVVGVIYVIAAVFSSCVLPENPDVSVTPQSSLLPVLKIPEVSLAACSILLASFSGGFLTATLEPHLRQFSLPPMLLGLMFVIMGATYGVSAPFYGWLCDKMEVSPKYITLSGSILILIGFLFIGPAPFIATRAILGLTALGLFITGLGVGACLVAAFTDALRTVVAHGLPNNIETYGLVSSLWTSSIALGFFIGPSVAGILKDTVGFRIGTMYVVGASFIVSVATAGFICCWNTRRRTYQKMESYDEFPWSWTSS